MLINALTRRDYALSVLAVAGASLLGSSPAGAADVSVLLTVPAIAQTKGWDCWLAAATMLLSWKTAGVTLSESEVASQAGQNYKELFDQDTGLLGSQFADFAAALNLVVEAPQNYTVAGYAALLSSHGPLWVGSELGVPGNYRKHVRILRGVIGDGTPDGTTAYVIDPDGGVDTTMTLLMFAQQLEDIARQEVKDGYPLIPQVIHCP